MLNTFKNKYLYYFLQFTWGIEANLLGLIACVFCKYILNWEITKYYKNFIICPKDKQLSSGLSLGIFLFMDKDADETLKQHEYGHSIQNLIFGPLWLELIAIWSFIRYFYYQCIIYHFELKGNYNYYSIWFERDASALGKRIVRDKIREWMI